jgi:hypothetical protein
VRVRRRSPTATLHNTARTSAGASSMSPDLTQNVAQCQGHVTRSLKKTPVDSGAPKCVHCTTQPVRHATPHEATQQPPTQSTATTRAPCGSLRRTSHHSSSETPTPWRSRRRRQPGPPSTCLFTNTTRRRSPVTESALRHARMQCTAAASSTRHEPAGMLDACPTTTSRAVAAPAAAIGK